MSDKIFVLAGTFDQFRLFRKQLTDVMIEEDIGFRYSSFVYINGPESLLGYSRDSIWGYAVGTWDKRSDINEIKLALMINGTSAEEFIEVAL